METELPIMLWENDHHDGPLSGIALYQGKKVWFDYIEWGGYQFMDPSQNPVSSSEIVYRQYTPRIFGLYELTPQELALQEEIHRRFQQCVGYHWDHDPKISRTPPHQKDTRDQFYEWMKTVPPRQYTDRPEIASFREDEFQQYERPYIE